MKKIVILLLAAFMVAFVGCKKEELTATITFDANGASGTPPKSQTVKWGEEITFPSEGNLTYFGYKFSGWISGSDLTDSYPHVFPVGMSITVNSDETFYAYWKKLYTVNFASDGATGTLPEPIEATVDDEITLPPQGDLAKYGYSFSGWKPTGWYEQYGELKPYENDYHTTDRGFSILPYQPGEKFCMKAGDVTFVAEWKSINKE